MVGENIITSYIQAVYKPNELVKCSFKQCRSI